MAEIEIPGRIWEKGDRTEMVKDESSGGVWRVSDLREAVKDQPEFDLLLDQFNWSQDRFDCQNLWMFAQHMRHVQEADLDYPVILNQWNGALDGRHRLVKALLEGRASVKAKKVPVGAVPTIRD